MSDKIWLGVIYLKEEGGYDIVIKSLNYYKKRLRTIENSPELKDSSTMLGTLLIQEARKIIPKINEIIKKIQDRLIDIKSLYFLCEDLPLLIKALSCYQTDIKRAQDTQLEYFLNLIGDLELVKNDSEIIKNALSKINQFN